MEASVLYHNVDLSYQWFSTSPHLKFDNSRFGLSDNFQKHTIEYSTVHYMESILHSVVEGKIDICAALRV